VDLDFACLWGQVQHNNFVVDTTNKQLMFIPFVIQTFWQPFLIILTEPIVSLVVKHLQVFVVGSWCNFDVGKCLSGSFEVTKSSLTKT
jgi:hypothetical protein